MTLPHLIIEELLAGGLGIGPNRLEYQQARVMLHGEREYRALKRRLSFAPGDLPASATALLGYGHVLTEFIAAGFHTGNVEPALTTGAVANLTIKTFDKMLDAGYPAESLLRREDLIAATDSSPPRSAAARLAKHYFELVRALPYAHDGVSVCLSKAILRMYDSEVATVRQLLALRTFEWRRKCGLPFVVLGLPLCLTVPTPPNRDHLGQLGWLYRLGELFGWLDDAADLEEDSAHHRPNRVQSVLGIQSPETIAKRIVLRVSRLMHNWEQGARFRPEWSVHRDCFLSAIWAWLPKAT